MKVFKIYFHVGGATKHSGGIFAEAGESGVVVGIVVNQDGTMTEDAALSLWNSQQPSYQGDTAMSGPFILA